VDRTLREVLNQPAPVSEFDFDSRPTAAQLDIAEGNFSPQEVKKAISSLKNNKSAGLDGITAELLKHGKEVVVDELTNLFNLIWEREEVPADWRHGVIITLPKKGNLSDCNNWRGITLLSVPGKAFCSVLLNRLKVKIDQTLRQEQAGFRAEGHAVNKSSHCETSSNSARSNRNSY